MLRELGKIRRVHQRLGSSGLVRFARKAVWERLPLHPTSMPFGPGHLQIEVSGKCNLECPACPRSLSRAGWLNMSLETYRRVIGSTPGLYSVNLQGFGEPLLHPDIEEIVRWTHERGVEVGLYTNGTLLGERRVRGLMEAGLDWLNVSMDGATRETFERLRVGASFESVLENVRHLVRLNQEAGGPLHLALAFVAMRSNLDEIPLLFELAQDLGVGHVFLAPVMQLTEACAEERLGPGEKTRLERLAAEGRSRGLEVGIGVFAERVRPGELPCDWPWRKAYVTADGRLTPCCIETEQSLGHAASDGVAALWNGDEYRRLRAGLTSASPHPICRKHCFLSD